MKISLADDGIDKLLTFVDTKLKKEDITDSWDKFNAFEEHKKKMDSRSRSSVHFQYYVLQMILAWTIFQNLISNIIGLIKN